MNEAGNPADFCAETVPADTARVTPAGRKIKAWAATRGPEAIAAADDLATALWACANNPPSDMLANELIQRRAAFNAVRATLET